jgi:uncharacterized protein YuzE
MQSYSFAIEIDDEADAAYVRVSAAPVAHTEEVGEGIMVDLDVNNDLAAVEVLGLREKVGTDDRTSYLHGLVAGLRLRTAAE